MEKLGNLKEIKDLRKVWPHEASDFTPWLAEDDNIARLGDAVGLDISVDETESSVGDFNVDIYATETGTGQRIIIENQLEDTNHDHLGKLITYAAGKDASIIIWLVKNAREEHRATIEWLNNHTDGDISFFLCEIKIFQIDDSAPAVKFEVIEQPNDWSRSVRKTETATTIQQLRYEYWTAFNEYAFCDETFANEFRKRKPWRALWMDFSIGSSECRLSVSQVRTKNVLLVSMYIDHNKEMYHEFLKHKEEIEKVAGMKFSWLEMPDKKASRISIEKPAKLENRSEWENQFKWLMDVLERMKKAFSPYL